MQNIIEKTSKFVKRTSKKAGMYRGTLVHVGEQKIDKPGITLINYDPDRFEEKELKRMIASISQKIYYSKFSKAVISNLKIASNLNGRVLQSTKS